MEGFIIETGKFYYISDEYYKKFKHCGLMTNKETDSSDKHGRPCFYCFKSDDYSWLIPISSQLEKYEKIYNQKIEKYPNYDGIRFGFVNGKRKAFLIQNLCPILEKYVDDEYRINHNTIPVTISDDLAAELNGLVRKVIRLHKQGIKIVLTNLDYILEQLNKEASASSS